MAEHRSGDENLLAGHDLGLVEEAECARVQALDSLGQEQPELQGRRVWQVQLVEQVPQDSLVM